MQLKRRNTASVRAEIARYLCLRYAPEMDLKLKVKPGDAHAMVPKEKYRGDPDAENSIHWAPGDGLTYLLHEIGHHLVEEGRPSEPPRDLALEVIEEAIAWRAAERIAKMENLFFDYDRADKAFATHAGSMPVRISWGHRETE